MMSTLVRKTRLASVSVRHRKFLREYERARRTVLKRDHYRCRHCGIRLGLRLETHHVVKRSHDPTKRLDEDNLVSLCRICHDWTDSAYASARGRLLVTPKGDGQFDFDVVKKPSKWTLDPAN